MGAVFRLLLALALLWAVNFTLLVTGHRTGCPVTFPIAILLGPPFHPRGVPYALAYLLVLGFGLRMRRLGAAQAWALGLLLLLFGNLAQGGFDAGFLKPFYEPYLGTHVQYFHDAVRIRSPGVWLSSFNTAQPHLLIHSRAHPPFAVLLHFFVLQAAWGNLAFLSLAFVLISSLTLPVVWLVLREVGADARRAGLLTLLLAPTPAFNIYGAVSLDGVIAFLASVFLLGCVRVARSRPSAGAVSLMTIGFLSVSLLSFGGVFLVVATGLAGLFQTEGRGRRALLTALAITVGMSALVFIAVHRVWGYDHVQAFMTASRLENRHGFLLVSRPLVYAMTRVEDVAEIVLFLSLGTAATMVRMPWRRGGDGDPVTGVMMGAVGTLALMFASGAYRTGETARACLFAYPYLLLALRRLAPERAFALICFAGVQTLVMQLLGNFFW